MLILATIGLNHYLVLGAMVFCIGIWVMSTKRNAIGILIGVELVLNASNINLVARSKRHPSTLLNITLRKLNLECLSRLTGAP